MRKFVLSAVIIAAAVAAAGPALAHHSTNLWYDMKKTETVQGEFYQMRWINPHTIVQFYVKGANGKAELWSAETHPTSVLAREGWKPRQFKPGQKMTIIGNPSRKGLKSLSLLEVKTDDGRTFKVNPSN